MKKTVRFGILAAAMLTFGFVLQPLALAQHDHGGGMSMPPAPTVRTGKVTGTLVSRDKTSIQVEAKQTGTATYMIDAKTKYKGDIQPGTTVTVKYEDRGGMQMATAVEAIKAKGKTSGSHSPK